MSQSEDGSTHRSRTQRSREQAAVRTTIVGGRPPGSGQPLGPVPRGIEVLVKKAAVDAEFKALLFERRARAANEIDLALDPAEAMMLDAVPGAQLEAIIAKTEVPQQHRRAFLGKAAAAMLAAIGAMGPTLAAAGIAGNIGAPGGIAPDHPSSRGIQPDRPPAKLGSLTQQRVIGLVARQLGLPADRVSAASSFVKDLKADAGQREAIRKVLELHFNVTISARAFGQLQTVGQAVRYVETAILVARPVVEAIARQLNVGPEKIGREMSLDGDLRLSTPHRARLRRELSSHFRIYTSWDAFKRLETVDDVINYVGSAVRRRQAGAQRRSSPSRVAPGSPGPPGASMGIRPGPVPKSYPSQLRGSSGGMGGIRPGRQPPLPPRDPIQDADELRRRAEEFRNQYRRRWRPSH